MNDIVPDAVLLKEPISVRRFVELAIPKIIQSEVHEIG